MAIASIDLPDDVEAFAQTRGFGAPITAWEVFPSRRAITSTIVGVALLCLGAIAVWGFFQLENLGAKIVVGVLGAAMIFGGIITLLTLLGRLRLLGLREYCYAGGVIERRGTQPPVAYPFAGNPLQEEVIRVYRNRQLVSTEYVLRFGPRGDQWRLLGDADVREPRHSVVAAASGQARAAELIDGLSRGERAEFGTVSLDPDAVVLTTGQRVPYGAIRSVDAQQGEWILTGDAGELARGSIAKMRDYRAFVALVDALRRATTDTAQ